MEKIKDFIAENKVLVIVFTIVVISSIGVFTYKNLNKETIEKVLTEEDVENTPFVNKNYKVNEYKNVTMELVDLLNEYHTYFVKLMLNNPEEAYELLAAETKEKYDSIDAFKEYIEKINTINLKSSKVKSYRENKEIIKTYDIIDTENIRYIIYEKSIWDFQIDIKGKIS